MPLRALAEKVGARLAEGADPETLVRDVKPLVEAGSGDLSFFDNRKYLAAAGGDQGRSLPGGAGFRRAGAARHGSAAHRKLPTAPLRARCSCSTRTRCTPKAALAAAGEPAVHPTAKLEDGVRVEPGAVVGREAQIGRGTTVAAGAVVGYRVTIGRDCYIGPGASVTHALVGDRVILHAGVRIGQDGFGFAMGATGAPEGAPGRPGYHPGRCGDRRQQLCRSRRS